MIACCCIVKDEAPTVERMVRSVRPFVDEINVYDTGSTDGTLEILARLASEPGAGVRVERGEWRNDFAWARNRSWAMCSPDVSWIMPMDADETLLRGDGLRAVVEELDRRGEPWALVMHDFVDRPNRGGWADWPRLFKQGACEWRGCVHEECRPHDTWFVNVWPVTTVHPSQVCTWHGRRHLRPGHYLKLAHQTAAETCRASGFMWLASELAGADWPVAAARAYARYLDMPPTDSKHWLGSALKFVDVLFRLERFDEAAERVAQLQGQLADWQRTWDTAHPGAVPIQSGPFMRQWEVDPPVPQDAPLFIDYLDDVAAHDMNAVVELADLVTGRADAVRTFAHDQARRLAELRGTADLGAAGRPRFER